MNKSLSKLRAHLKNVSPGEVKDTNTVVKLLAPCWSSLPGSDEQKTWAYKLDRMEQVEWQPPVLSFVIERHGGAVLGSSRADLHRWTVDTETGKASCNSNRWRPLSPPARRLKVEPLVDEVVELMTTGADDDRVKWLDEKKHKSLARQHIIRKVHDAIHFIQP
jgi:hypothetical protein